MLWKGTNRGLDQALLILNKDPHNWQHFHVPDLYEYIQAPPPLKDVSRSGPWTMSRPHSTTNCRRPRRGFCPRLEPGG